MFAKLEGRIFTYLFSDRAGRVRCVGSALLVGAALLAAGPAFAQFGPPATSTPSTQAVQLPLSGRTAQSSGTVKTSEAPAPSTTATVNTLSPNVQVQGAYAGSTPGTS